MVGPRAGKQPLTLHPMRVVQVLGEVLAFLAPMLELMLTIAAPSEQRVCRESLWQCQDRGHQCDPNPGSCTGSVGGNAMA